MPLLKMRKERQRTTQALQTYLQLYFVAEVVERGKGKKNRLHLRGGTA
jgi:hypothetical protein